MIAPHFPAPVSTSSRAGKRSAAGQGGGHHPGGEGDAHSFRAEGGPTSLAAEDHDAPLREVDVDLPVALRPRLVEGVAGPVPAAERRILRAKDLLPLAVV